MKVVWFLYFGIAILLAGCSSVSEVERVGVDQYTLSSSMFGNFPSWPEVKDLAIKKANVYCDAKGEQMTVVGWDTHGARGWTPLDANLKFTCQPKGVQTSNTAQAKQGNANQPATKQDAVNRLEELKALRDKGLITQDEYDKKRQQILNGL